MHTHTRIWACMLLCVCLCVCVLLVLAFFWRFLSHFHRPSQLWRTWRLLISVNHLPFHLLPPPSLCLSLASSSASSCCRLLLSPKKISRNNDVSAHLWLESVVLQFAAVVVVVVVAVLLLVVVVTPLIHPLSLIRLPTPPRVVKIFCQLDRPFECCFLEAPRKIDMALGQLVSWGSLSCCVAQWCE